MANTYTQIHIQAVFAVKYRQALIMDRWRDELHRYLSAIIQNQGHKSLIVNSREDHVHMLFGLRPMQALSDVMQVVKQDSSRWINRKHLTATHFAWQSGFGAFSYAKNQLPAVIAYIEQQEEHHRQKSFQEEYQEVLEEFKIEYNDNYIFHPPE